jgi:hypothetical protein
MNSTTYEKVFTEKVVKARNELTADSTLQAVCKAGNSELMESIKRDTLM